jgi:hypothetical protein
MSLPILCRIVTVAADKLPPGHAFVIVHRPDADVPWVFTTADARHQIEARAAFLQWDRQRAATVGGIEAMLDPDDGIADRVLDLPRVSLVKVQGVSLVKDDLSQQSRFTGYRDEPLLP